MNKIKNAFTILFFSLTLISCEQTKTKSISNSKNNVYTKNEAIDEPDLESEGKIETLTLIYNAISCTCAQWSETRFNNMPDKKIYYWLEPADKKLINADTLFNGENLPVIIKVTGQISNKKGFPKNRNLAKVEAAAGNVFRYTKIEVIKNGQNKIDR